MEKDIISGNKIIAEFMGLKPFEDSRYGIMYENPLGLLAGGSIFGDAGLKYHTSWDWLMPVVEKIKTMEKDYPIRTGEILDFLIWYPIEIIWKAVIEFIQWYNQNK